ncbi:MAG: hypothetical protein ACJ8CR_14070 [Roseiflexaceae bacterium]
MTRTTKSKGRPAQQRRSPLLLPLVVIAMVVIAVIGWSILSRAWSTTTASGVAAGDAAHGQSGAEMPHIHGMGFLPPIFAAAAQSLPDLGILANSSRLLRQK